ncbi:MAG TPA: AraC family transcriptional regulator [Caulobacter sp.]|nr:AraC family transcriptional regulator [Caulobacter sp.]HJV41933.1 AraC family transcriptional regulator [Caulobacter sp.]
MTSVAQATVSGGFFRALLDFTVSLGADRDALLASTGVREADFADQDARVPLSAYKALYRAGQDMAGEPALALKFPEATRFEQISIVGLICQSADTMGGALKQLNRFSRLVVEVDGVSDGPRFQLVPRDDGLWLQDRCAVDDFPELVEAALARFTCEMARHYPDFTFVLAAHLTRPRPAHAADYPLVLRAPVTFGAAWNALKIEPSWLNLAIHRPNRYAFGMFNSHADALLKSLETSKTTRGQVEALLIPLLHTGELAMDDIARSLGLSRQTLYRRLKAEGVSFDQVLDRLRHSMAETYLEKLSVNETAYLVGFSEASAFSRAFKRWTGASPRSRRQG